MTGAIANPHHIEPVTKSCLGCGRPEGSCSTEPECPAFYRRLDGLLIIVTPAERLVVCVPGQIALRLTQREMFEVRDTVDLGVKKLRESGRSTAAPT